MHGIGYRGWLVAAVVVVSLVAAIPASSAASSDRGGAVAAPAGAPIRATTYGGPTPSAGPVTCSGSTTYTAAQIVILANGTVYPYGTAPVTHVGDTYTLTEPVQASVLVLVSNAIVDGSYCVVRYDAVDGHGNNTDVEARDDSNVTLEYFNASATDVGIETNDSSGVTVFESISLNAAYEGIWANNSRDINLSENNVSYSKWGIYLQNVLGGQVEENQAFEGVEAVDVASSADVLISHNVGRYTLDVGADLEDSTNISVDANDFSNNQNGSGDGLGFISGQDTSDTVVGNNFSGNQLYGAEFDGDGGLITFADNDLTGGTEIGLLLEENYYGVFDGYGNDIQNATQYGVYLQQSGTTNLTANNLSTRLGLAESSGFRDQSNLGAVELVDNVIDGPWTYSVFLDSDSGAALLEGNQISGFTVTAVYDYTTPSGLEILGNTISTAPTAGAEYGLDLDYLYGTSLIAGNHLSGAFNVGVALSEQYGPTTVRDNVLANFTGYGVLAVFSYSSLVITDNDLASNATTRLDMAGGFYLDGYSYAGLTVSGNDLSGDYYGGYLDDVYSGLVVIDNFAEDTGDSFFVVSSAVDGVALFEGNDATAQPAGALYGLAVDGGNSNLTVADNHFAGPFEYDIQLAGPVTGYENVSDNVAANFTSGGIFVEAEAGLSLNGNDVGANASSASNATYALDVDVAGGPSAEIEDNNASGGVGVGLYLSNAYADSTFVSGNDFARTQTIGIDAFESDGPVYLVGNDAQESNGTGVEVANSAYAFIEGNQVQGSDLAIEVYNVDLGTTIAENNASGSGVALVAFVDYYYSVATIQANDFSDSSAAYVNWTLADLVGNNFLGTPLVGLTDDDFEEFYHNNLETGAGATLNLTGSSPATGSFNAPLPIGGNFWTGYVPTSCTDGICAPAYLVPSLTGSSGYYDNYPLGQAWTSYAITFAETGLPAGTGWSVRIDGGTLTAIAPAAIEFYPQNLAPVLYSFQIPGVGSFTDVSPASGSVNASGRSLSVAVTFSEPTYSVAFSETGIGSGVTWFVNSTGSPSFTSAAFTVASTAGQSFDLGNLTNGTYAFTVALDSRSYATTDPLAATFTIHGTAVTVTYAYSAVTFEVVFAISGLPTASTWSVTLAGTSASSAGTTITFAEANGTYPYTVTVPAGYNVSAGASVVVNGSPVNTYLTAAATPSTSTSSSGSLLLLGALIAIAAIAVVGWALFFRKRGTGGPPPGPPAAWSETAPNAGAPPPGAMGGAPPPSPPPGS